MSEIVRPSGVRVDVADDLVTLADAPAQAPEHRRRRRSARRSTTTRGAATAAGAQPDDETVALLAALEADDIRLVDAIDVTPRPDALPARRRRRGGTAAPTAALDPVAVTVDVPLAAGEEAVVLVEEDGVYQWVFGTAQPGVDARPATRRGARAARTPVATHSKRFAIELALDDDADDAPAIRRRRARRGFFRRTLIGKAVVYVLKFAARKAAGAIVRRKERHVVPGLVDMTTAGGTRFPALDLATRATPLPTDRPLRILLFVHGTFSSTLGSFGWLDMTPDGKAFLEAAHARYDLVIGYDHRTLSETPRQNAEGLFDALVGLPAPAGAPHIDAVAYSRGGLVLRTFVEEVLPANGWGATIGTCTYVACTHAGTQLASEENAKRFVDRYTNLAVGACRGVALIPGATPWAMLASTVLGGLGEVVKDLAEWALDEGGIPGLAAMEPTGETVKRLNAALATSGTVRDYRVVESTFDVTRASSTAVPGALDSFVMRLKDRLADELLTVPNDLVVDVASMTAIGGDPARFVKARHDFGVNPSVHHCNYFVQPATTGALASWLGLEVETGGARRGRRRRRGGARATPQPETPTLGTQLLFVDAAQPLGDVLARLRDAGDVDYLIVERDAGANTYTYAIAPDELVARATRRDPVDLSEPILDTLDLHESTSTPDGAPDAAPQPAGQDARPSTARRIVRDAVHGAPVAVVPTAEELVDESRILYRERAVEVRAATITELVGPPAERRSAKPPVRDDDGDDRPGWAGSEPAAMLPPAPELDFDGGGSGRAPASRGGTTTRPNRRTASKKPVAQPTDTGTYAPPAAGSAPTAVDVHMQAGTDAEWVVGERTDIVVALSREQLERELGEVGGDVMARVDASMPITLHVTARENAVIGADPLREVTLPAAGAPVEERFTAHAIAEGRVRVDVQLMQNRVRLARLTLTTQAVVAAPKGRSRATPRAEATAAVTPAAARAPVDVLVVSEDPSEPQPNAFIRYDVSFAGVTSAPAVRDQGFSEKLRQERRAYIDRIYARIQDRWEAAGEDAEAFARDLRAIGIELWNAIVPPRIQRLLWERRDRLDGLQVLSTEAYVPWELVFVNEPGATKAHKEGRYLGEVGLTRWTYGGGGTGFAPEALRWGRMRVVQPEYTDDGWALEGAADEAHALVKTYKAKRVEARPNTVYTLVADGDAWDVLHFCGHGEAEAATIEEAALLMDVRTVDGEEKKDVVLASTVATEAVLRTEGDLTGPGHIVVLNACQVGRAGETLAGIGGFARAFVDAGAGLFVAPLWSVGDDLASTFCATLYARLVAGDTVAQATRAARTAARDNGDATWLSYAVYGEPTARIVKR